MTRQLQCLGVALCLSITTARAADTWQRIGPLVSDVSSVSAHPTDPNTVYFMTENGMKRTADSGATWTDVPVPCPRILFDPVTPTVMYAYGITTGIYRSNDGGTTWTQTATFFSTSLAIDPGNHNRLYAGSIYPSDFYVSTDGGATWTPSPTGGYLYLNSIAVDPTDGDTVYAGMLGDFDSPGTGLYRSTDGGATWSHVSLGSYYGAEIACVVIDPFDHDILYLGTTAGGWQVWGMLRSYDGGATWGNAGIGQYYDVADIAADPLHPGILYAVSDRALYKMLDRGDNWARIDNSALDFISDVDLCHANPDVVAVASGYGLVMSSDGGASFVQHGATPARMEALEVDRTNPDVLWATGRGVFRSLDGGAHWQPTRTVGFGMSIVQHPAATQVIYEGAYTDGELVKSTDAGATWAVTLKAFINDIAIAPSNPSIMYSGGLVKAFVGGVFRSADAGDHWTTVANLQTDALAVDPTDADVVYLGNHVGMYKSTNGGSTWTAINNGLNQPASGYVLAVEVDPAQPQTVYCGTYSQGVFKTSDGGTSWAHLGVPITDCRAIEIDPTDTRVVYASEWDGSVFVTVDGGAHWQRLSGLAGGGDLRIEPGNRDVIYAAHGGIWRYERTTHCAEPAIISHVPGDVDLGACAGGCNLVFDVATNGVYTSVAVSALEHRVDGRWLPVAELQAPLPGPAWQLTYHVSAADAPGLHSFRCVTRGGDGARSVSDVVDVMFTSGPVPTLFSSIDAIYRDGAVSVTWSTMDAAEVQGFNLYRKMAGQGMVRLNARLIDSSSRHAVDARVNAGVTYEYEVTAVTAEGELISPRAAVTIPALSLGLDQNQPNPFNPSTRISFQVPATVRAQLEVYDVRGQRVATILDRIVGAGRTDVPWDGLDDGGREVSSGVYFYRLTVSDRILTRRMVLVR
jgi:photosystem II stability/assembly factor-like uncharacterized protein